MNSETSASLEPVVPPAVTSKIRTYFDEAYRWGECHGERPPDTKRRVVGAEEELAAAISDALREATRVERERCAKVICMACHYGMLHENGECTAAAIRRSPTSDATK